MFMGIGNTNYGFESPLSNIGAGIGVGLAEAGINQMFNQYNAAQDYKRQKKLMDKQFALNMAGQKNAATNTVEGMRMAGLNPALANGQVQTGASEGLGAASMAQSPKMEVDPMVLSTINKLDAEANKDAEMAQSQKNVNDAWSDENKALPGYMKVLATKWQGQSWYNDLSDDTRDTIDAIAAGDENITIGKFNALQKSIENQDKMSNADKNMVQNAFDVARMTAQINDSSLWDSIVKDPLVKYNLNEAQIKGINQQVKESVQKILNLVQDITESKSRTAKNYSDIKLNNANMKLIETKSREILENDIGILVNDGRYGKAFAKKVDDYAQVIVGGLMQMLSAIFIKQGLSSKSDGAGPKIVQPSDKQIIQLNGPRSFVETKEFGSGVGQFRWQ